MTVKYWGWVVPPGYAAITIGPVVFVRKQYRGNHALLAHEQVHVRQWRRNKLRFWPRYLLSRKWRLAYELEAYRVQLALEPSGLERFALALAHGYWLGISIEQARAMLLSVKPDTSP